MRTNIFAAVLAVATLATTANAEVTFCPNAEVASYVADALASGRVPYDIPETAKFVAKFCPKTGSLADAQYAVGTYLMPSANETIPLDITKSKDGTEFALWGDPSIELRKDGK